MKTLYQIDLALVPDTFDIVHVTLLVFVLLLSIMQFIVTLLWLLSLSRKRKIATHDVTPASAEPAPVTPSVSDKPELKVVEKIVEKIVPGPAPKPVIIKEFSTDAAAQLLSLLQKEARFIDFIKEDISDQTDQDIGVVARVVHAGCLKVINENFSLSPIRKEQENSPVKLAKNFDANTVNLMGNIVGKPPFTGILIHKGWQVSAIRLPKITEGHNVNIIAPAEVEL